MHAAKRPFGFHGSSGREQSLRARRVRVRSPTFAPLTSEETRLEFKKKQKQKNIGLPVQCSRRLRFDFSVSIYQPELVFTMVFIPDQVYLRARGKGGFLD